MGFEDSLAMAAGDGVLEMGRAASANNAVIINGTTVAAIVKTGAFGDLRDSGGLVSGVDCQVTILAVDAVNVGVKTGSVVVVPGMAKPQMQVIAVRVAGSGAVWVLDCAGAGAGRGLNF